MKPDNRLLRMTPLRFLTFGLLLAVLFGLSGCMVTNKVLDFRKEREARTKEAINFWSLAAVHSAHVMPEGEVFACVEFRDFPADEPQAYTINLSQASRIGKTYADLMPADCRRTESPRQAKAQIEMVWYLYPLVEAQKGCDKPAGENPFPVSAVKIETVQMQREDPSRLPAILMSPNSDSVNEDQVIEVSFLPENQTSKAEPESKKRPVAGPDGTEDIRMVYMPAGSNGEQVRAIGIAGAFEPGSEWVNPYTLLVAPAVAADVVLDTAIVIFAVGVYGGWACGR